MRTGAETTSPVGGVGGVVDPTVSGTVTVETLRSGCDELSLLGVVDCGDADGEPTSLGGATDAGAVSNFGAGIRCATASGVDGTRTCICGRGPAAVTWI